MSVHRFLIALALACLTVAPASAATLKGRFVYDGTPPTPAKLAITKDAEVCAAHAPVDEGIVVGKEGGLANVLVWVRKGADDTAAPEEAVALDNANCRFNPHVMVVQVGQTLELKNSDPVGHNSNIATVMNPATNQSIPPNGSTEVTFKAEERLPSKVSCGIHPWMTAWVLVRPNSYAAVSGEDGSFEISGLPEGAELEFQVWQETAGYVSDVELESGDEWKRGRFTVTLDGDLDLGEIKVSPEAFKK